MEGGPIHINLLFKLGVQYHTMVRRLLGWDEPPNCQVNTPSHLPPKLKRCSQSNYSAVCQMQFNQ